MSNRSAYVDFQQRASEFEVGDLVYPFQSGNAHITGRVVAVYPAIGMVDVEWPHGNERVPVEDLQRQGAQGAIPPSVEHDNVPGGDTVMSGKSASAKGSLRVAQAFVKKSLYWAGKDRHYKATRSEISAGSYGCPKCKQADLRPVAYKRRDGASEKLMGCPDCLFLVKKCDIMGHPDYIDDAAEAVAAKKPFAGIRLARQNLMAED